MGLGRARNDERAWPVARGRVGASFHADSARPLAQCDRGASRARTADVGPGLNGGVYVPAVVKRPSVIAKARAVIVAVERLVPAEQAQARENDQERDAGVSVADTDRARGRAAAWRARRAR